MATLHATPFRVGAASWLVPVRAEAPVPSCHDHHASALPSPPAATAGPWWP